MTQAKALNLQKFSDNSSQGNLAWVQIPQGAIFFGEMLANFFVLFVLFLPASAKEFVLAKLHDESQGFGVQFATYYSIYAFALR
jgi:hypothetical protein